MLGNSTIVNTFRLADNTPTWFPSNTAISGTVTSTSVRVIGTNTAFVTEKISEGDYMVNASNEARKIFRIVSETEIELETAFTVDLTAATVTRLKDKQLKYLKVTFTDNDGSIRGANQASDAIWPYENTWTSPDVADFIQPQLVTPGSGGASVITGE